MKCALLAVQSQILTSYFTARHSGSPRGRLQVCELMENMCLSIVKNAASWQQTHEAMEDEKRLSMARWDPTPNAKS